MLGTYFLLITILLIGLLLLKYLVLINLKFASRCHLRYCRLQGGLAGPAGDSSPAVCQDVPGQSQRKRDGHQEEGSIQGSVECHTERCRICYKLID